MAADDEATVLVLNWNGAAWLRASLDAVRNERNVWVVDNGSTDRSVQLVHDEFPSVNVFQLDRNYGYGGAYNRALAAVDTPLVALLNNDTVAQPGWLDHLRTSIAHDDSVGAVGAKLLEMNRPAYVGHAGGRLTTLGAAYDVGLGAIDGPAFEVAGLSGCATGAAVLMRRDALIAVGGFDERYFAFFDDADLCWRMWLAGYAVHFEPKARVWHAYGGSLPGGRGAALRLELCQTNRLQNMFKHLETKTLAAALGVSLSYDLMRVADLLRAGRPDGMRALVRGTRKFVVLLPQVLAERRRIQSTRKRSDRDLRALGVLAGVRRAAREWRRLGSLNAAAAPAALSGNSRSSAGKR
jgi:GT2 family glycosyltransferase